MPEVAGLWPIGGFGNARPDLVANMGAGCNYRWDGDISPYGATEGDRGVFYQPGLYLTAMSFSGIAQLPWPGDYHMTAGFKFLSSVWADLGPQIDQVITVPAGTTPEDPYVLPPLRLLYQGFIRMGSSWFGAASGGGDLVTPPVLVTGFEPADGPTSGPGSGTSVGTSLAAIVNFDFSLAMRNEMYAAYDDVGGLSFNCFTPDTEGQRVTVVPHAAVATTETPPLDPPPPLVAGAISAQAVRKGSLRLSNLRRS